MKSACIAVGGAWCLAMAASAQVQYLTQARSVKAQSVGMPLLTEAAPDFGPFSASLQSIGTPEAQSNGRAYASQQSTLGTGQLIGSGWADRGKSNAFFSGYGTALSKHVVTFTVPQDTIVNFVTSFNYANVSLQGQGISFVHGSSGSSDETGLLLAGKMYTVTAETSGDIQVGNAIPGSFSFWLTLGGVPPVPTSARASPASSACPGSAVLLSVAQPPAGYVNDWYESNATDTGLDFLGTGASLTVFPTRTPNQYFYAKTRRVSDDAISVQQATVVVPVANASMPSSIAGPSDLCMYQGGTIQLTAFGGSGTSYEWFEGSCDGTPLGAGKTISVPAPSASTTYYVRRVSGCVVSACNSYLVTVRSCPGDFDCSGWVEDSDFVSFASAYDILLCSSEFMPANCPADLNGDELVDDADFVQFVSAYDALVCP